MTTKPVAALIVPGPLRRKLFAQEDLDRLAALTQLRITDAEEHLTTEQAIELLHAAEIGIGSWGTPRPDEQLLAGCPNLKLWVHAAGSIKAMHGPHLEARDLTIASCKPALADNVAEFTLGCMLLGIRGSIENLRDHHRRTDQSLFRKTIGIVGASLIGTKVIQLLKPFRCQTLLYDPFATPAQAAELGVELEPDLLQLCARSRIVSLHVPFLESTREMLRAEHFQAMADDTIFINTARGACIDEPALIAQLRQGRLFAFLDVSNPEPAAPDSPLRSLSNVMLTAHIAGGFDVNIGAQAIDDVERYLRGQRPLCVLTVEELDRVA